MNWLKLLVLKYAPAPVLRILKKHHYRRSVAKSTIEEVREHKLLTALIRAGDTVLDIGANVGYYTKAFSGLVGTEGRVHSFEPVPFTHAMLQSTVKSLGLRNVTVHNLALSDGEGEVVMAIPRLPEGVEVFYEAKIVGSEDTPGLTRVAVRRARLDFVLAATETIAFIKMDVEGHELSCSHGAAKTIERHSPALLVEFSSDPDEAGSDAGLLIRWLSERGYGTYWWDEHKLRRRERNDASVDYLFLKPEHIERLRALALPGLS